MFKVILTNGSISPAPFSGQRTLIIPSHLMLSHYFNVSGYAFFFSIAAMRLLLPLLMVGSRRLKNWMETEMKNKGEA